ncbi:MAG: phosphoribosylformylglycinamidine synthase I [Gemmatimonadota bacterium]|nr:MAG: phosphoribosylformylglycinamidine synthase I [Gemmatimonadota bacterium]
MKVKTCILRAAGTNCDLETDHAFQLAGSETELVHINRLKRKERDLANYHILVIPGGFTYGDDIAGGKILANELKYNLQESIREFIDDGKLILGICNGFQVLVKAGLLSGDGKGREVQRITLTWNDSAKFEDRWIYLKILDNKRCVFTRGMEGLLYIPVAHAEGKFVTSNDDAMRQLWANNQVVCQYVDPQGAPAEYPWNPNGSMDAIAGICDRTGRIFGLMPHPERHIHPTNHPRWTRGFRSRQGEGLQIFKNAVDFVKHNL